MLSQLTIKNYALIKQLQLQPAHGLNIITGETGAGKSIILGALGLLLGHRADTKALYDDTEKCSIEGQFDLSKLNLTWFFEQEDLDYEPECIIRREISPTGKSRAYINDTPVTLETLKSLGELLIEIHSQHDSLSLASADYQLNLIDLVADNSGTLGTYKQNYKAYITAKKQLEQLKVNAAENKKEFDFNKHQYDELNRAQLQAGELSTLEEELAIAEHAQEVRDKLQLVLQNLYEGERAAVDLLEESNIALAQLSKYGERYAELKNRLQSNIADLKDIHNESSLALKSVDFEENNQERLRSRINQINGLLQKHRMTTETELLQLKDQLKAKVEEVLNIDDLLKEAENTLKTANAAMEAVATKLTNTRLKVIPAIQNQMNELLAALGMKEANFVVEHQNIAANAMGFDQIVLKFTANKGIAPQTLKNIASGGEFSRLMLALKYILAEKRALPTLIFDEIDTGVSGEISIKVGKMMQEMAKNHQIIAITHLHHIAAQGNSHYYVYKDHSASKTSSNIRLLNKQERINEIAQMIGGANPSQGIVNNAKEILEKYEIDLVV